MKTSESKLKIIAIILFAILLIVFIFILFQKKDPLYENTMNQSANLKIDIDRDDFDDTDASPSSNLEMYPPTHNSERDTESIKVSNFPKPTLVNPSAFGFTKVIDLPGIGVRASFPEDAKVYYINPSTDYQVYNSSISFAFSLYDYQGGSRRSWFRSVIGRSESVFEPFSANNHEGYLSISKDSEGNLYDLYYFTVARKNKMLLIKFTSSYDKRALDKFKSFLSALFIIEPNPQGIARSDQMDFNLYRWSENKKIAWEDANLGVRVIVPEWIEIRIVKGRTTDGDLESEWKKVYPEVNRRDFFYANRQFNGITVFTKKFYIFFLGPEYNGKTFDDIANDLLLGAGSCSEGWKRSTSECQDRTSCYTRNDVVKNLVIRKTAKLGPYTGQLRGINASFSQKYDCREDEMWIIQAKNKEYIVSTIDPNGEMIKLEGF